MPPATPPLLLTPGHVSLDTLRRIVAEDRAVTLDPAALVDVERSAALVADAAAGDAAVYGVNTGFGKLAQQRIAPADTGRLQRNLILSHCCGVGTPTPRRLVRLMIALKLLSLGRGASGVRPALLAALEGLLVHDVTPIVPRQGSVGASGDLAPLAHVGAVLLGEGEAEVAGERLPAGEALRRVGLAPLELAPKEGLALINGTQFSCALALAASFEAEHLLRTAVVIGAMSIDAAMGSIAPFAEEIQTLRGHPGQIDVARGYRALLAGSSIVVAHAHDDERVQDPYCLRCQPQVVGACLDLLRQAARTLVIEANAVTDNPLVLRHPDRIVSGGNFHAEPVAFAADQTALAIAELGSIAQRRIATLVDPQMSFGLPPFLSPDPGLHSGYMIAEVTAAALFAENKQRAAPCSVDSTPTSANQEDHVSMAAHAAWRLFAMNRNLRRILAIELLVAAQGIEMRAPLTTSPALAAAVALLRTHVPALRGDHYLAPDLERAATLLEGPEFLAATGIPDLPHL